MSGYLKHYGILGQKWGVRNGPPYPLTGGSYSPSEKRAKYKKIKTKKNIDYNKRHFDDTLKADKDILTTLSYDKDRTKGADMFYAAYKPLDKHQYNALFNKPIPKDITDENGNKIGTGHMYKYQINNKVKSDVKIASEDSSAEVFRQLYKNNRDFYNFVTDEDRMQKYFVKDKYKFKGYRESKKVLDKLKDPDYIPTSDELQKAYRMFNYVIPYDGAGADKRGASDVMKQRAKFFKAMKDAGYGAILDTNDALYGAFKASAPVIVFDMEQVILSEIKDTNMSSKQISTAIFIGRRFFGV